MEIMYSHLHQSTYDTYTQVHNFTLTSQINHKSRSNSKTLLGLLAHEIILRRKFQVFSFFHFFKMLKSNKKNRPFIDYSTKQTHYQPRLWESKLELNLKLCLWNWALRNGTLQSTRLLLVETLKRVFGEFNKNFFAITGFEKNPWIVFPEKLCHDEWEWTWWWSGWERKELRDWFWGLVREEKGLEL